MWKVSDCKDEKGSVNGEGMNIIRNEGRNKIKRSRNERVSYKGQRTINASLNAWKYKITLSHNVTCFTRQATAINFLYIPTVSSLTKLNIDHITL